MLFTYVMSSVRLMMGFMPGAWSGTSLPNDSTVL